jgi:hypothetical protein
MCRLAANKPLHRIADNDTDFLSFAQSQFIQSAPEIVDPLGHVTECYPFVLIGRFILGTEQVAGSKFGYGIFKQIDQIVGFGVNCIKVC